MMTDVLEPTLSEVFIANRPQLWRVAQKIVRTPDWADEVLQDAYLKLLDSSPLQEIRKPLSYCSQIVRNLALDYFRHHAMEANYRTYCDDVEQLQVAGGITPDQGLDERNILLEIDKVLDTLPPRTRQAFELYRLGGMTQRDIGVRLECSATLVNFMIRDAIKALEGCRDLLA